MSHVLVKARVKDLHTVPKSLRLSEGEDFEEDSWSSSFEVPTIELLGAADEDPMPLENVDPRPFPNIEGVVDTALIGPIDVVISISTTDVMMDVATSAKDDVVIVHADVVRAVSGDTRNDVAHAAPVIPASICFNFVDVHHGTENEKLENFTNPSCDLEEVVPVAEKERDNCGNPSSNHVPVVHVVVTSNISSCIAQNEYAGTFSPSLPIYAPFKTEYDWKHALDEPLNCNTNTGDALLHLQNIH
ncbi:hypothetical protein ZWY2020_040727 [Hordeum vulgare]|nr:hypothetical protein ZWY2020_040727 [Hordeum vulgare]